MQTTQTPQIQDQAQAIHVIGIELRTSNLEAFQTIPPLWQRFGQEGVLARIPGKLNGDVYAVYTDFENAGRDNQGEYSLVIGAQVQPGTPVPAGLARAVIPAARRAVFAVDKGRFDKVGEKWQEIWARTDLAKTFIADYERYLPGGEIDIFVGIEKQALPA